MIKLGASKIAGMVILTLVQGALDLAVALIPPWPRRRSGHGSALCHATYNTFLAFAYEHGDLSRVYPIARGAATMAVLAASALFLSDANEPMSVAAVLVLGLGILGMARGALATGESRRLIPYALGAAAGTAGYTLGRRAGRARRGQSRCLCVWLLTASALLFPPVGFAMRGRGLLRVSGRVWAQGTLAALASYGPMHRGLGDDAGADCPGERPARDLDPLPRADRLGRFRRPHGPGQGDFRGADRHRGGADRL